MRLLDDGFRPSNKGQGYELRRLLRHMVRDGVELDHEVWRQERDRQRRLRQRYERLRRRHRDQPPEWWWETHGIDVHDVE